MGKSERDNTTASEAVAGNTEEVPSKGSSSSQTAPAPSSFAPLPQANYPDDFATFPAIYNQVPGYTAPPVENFNNATDDVILESWDTQYQGQEDLDNLLNADYGLGGFDDASLWMDVKL